MDLNNDNQTRQPGGDYPGGLLTLLAVVAAVGAGVFVWTALDAPREAWRIYLVNFLVSSGVVSGAVALAAIFEVSGARWVSLVRRAAESCAAALPAVVALFLITYLGRGVLMSWAAPDSGVHKPWLDVSSIYLRGTLGLALLAGLGLAFANKSRREGFGATRRLATAYLFVYVMVTSILAIDLLMALDPHWVSSLFGGYMFTGNIYAGIAASMVLAIIALRWLGGARHSSVAFQMTARSNMGKMLFSFAMIWMYMIWSQHLVIWYGNLPHETGYVQLRLATQPWQTLSCAVLLMNFILPFVLLIPKVCKLNQNLLLMISLLILAGTWIERFILATPELIEAGAPVFSLRAALITAGFAAGFLLMVLTSLRRVSMLELRRVNASE